MRHVLSRIGLGLCLFVAVVTACRRAADPAARVAAPAAAGAVAETRYAARAANASGPMFSELTASQTGLDFQIVWDKPSALDHLFYSQNAGGGVTVGDYDADGRPDVYLTRPSHGNRLFRNLGDCRFEDVTERAGLRDDHFWGTGACLIDIDNDGDLDLYACSYGNPNRLHINQGDGTFRQQPDAFGLDFNGASVMMAFADYDHDGDLDGYLVTAGLPPDKQHPFRVKFVDGRPVVLDELREHWQLLYMPGERARQVEAGQYDHLFRNDGPNSDGSWRFTDVSKSAGMVSPDIGQAAVWWDYNSDGHPDLYVANDYWGPDHLYRNQGDGTFVDVAPQAFVHTPWSSMGVDIADINQDGRLDLMATDMAGSNHFRQKVGMGDMGQSGWFLEYGQPRQYSRNAVYLNSGTDRFMEAAFMTDLDSSDWTWTPRFDDLDNDGWIDLLITNGTSREFTNSDLNDKAKQLTKEGTPEFFKFWRDQDYRRDQNLMYRNLGDLRFENVSQAWGFDRVGVSFGAATADFDQDGDLDVIVNNMDVPAQVYRNNSTSGNSLRLKLEGTRSNRQALGATIRLTHGGQQQLRYLTATRGWMSSSEPIVHFGVGDATHVDQVTIRWPSGQQQELSGLSADRVHLIREPQQVATAAVAQTSPAPAAWFARSTEIDSLQMRHRETPFDDYQRQPLLPNKLSQLGPCLASADLNADGHDDFFVGGAAGQPGQILVSTATGYQPLETPALTADQACEDMGALFFDADQDGDADLYVVSGGGEWDANAPELQDRLYRNHQGEFTADVNALPVFRTSGSVVSAGDYDRDGDLDVFVGGRVMPGDYPLPPPSHVLRNDGGRFADATAEVLGAASSVGMVTSAVWSDADNDGWIDLLVTYEWGPVRYFRNGFAQRQQQLAESADDLPGELPPVLTDNTTSAGLNAWLGWWNGITPGDVDGDGDQDYVVTNFGLNTKYHASVDHPASIYYGDFDGSGKAQIIESEYEDDQLFPVRGKSCSTNAMPFLAERFATYTDFGMAQLQEIYTPERLAKAHRVDATELQSGVLLNQGAGRFAFRPLPRIAQIAPCFGAELVDVNADGNLDLYVVQNFHSPQRETGFMDGGVSLLLLGDGQGNWQPVWPNESGLVVGGDAKSVIVTDLNRDGRPDFLVTQNDGPLVGFTSETSLASAGRFLWLESSAAGSAIQPIGALITVRCGEWTQTRELTAGGGYLAQHATRAVVAVPADAIQAEVEVRWPQGNVSRQIVPLSNDSPVTRAELKP